MTGNQVQRHASLTLCPSVEPFLESSGALYLLPSSPDEQLRIPAPFGRVVYSKLVQPMDCSDISDADHEAAADVIEELVRRDLAGPLFTPNWRGTAVGDHYDRQMHFFTQLRVDAVTAQERLANARVLVLGLGGLGSGVATGLARLGVGTLCGVDFDRVEIGNLPRQTLFTADDLGQPKIAAAKRRLHEIEPALSLEMTEKRIAGPDDVAELIDLHSADLVVSAADSPHIAFKHWVDEACFEAKVPFILGGQRPPYIYIGPFVVPGKSNCFECFGACEARVEGGQLMQELELSRVNFEVPSVGFADQLIASFLVSEICSWIVGAPSTVLFGRELELDFRTYEQRWIEPARATCERCGARDADALPQAA